MASHCILLLCVVTLGCTLNDVTHGLTLGEEPPARHISLDRHGVTHEGPYSNYIQQIRDAIGEEAVKEALSEDDDVTNDNDVTEEIEKRMDASQFFGARGRRGDVEEDKRMDASQFFGARGKRGGMSPSSQFFGVRGRRYDANDDSAMKRLDAAQFFGARGRRGSLADPSQFFGARGRRNGLSDPSQFFGARGRRGGMSLSDPNAFFGARGRRGHHEEFSDDKRIDASQFFGARGRRGGRMDASQFFGARGRRDVQSGFLIKRQPPSTFHHVRGKRSISSS